MPRYIPDQVQSGQVPSVIAAGSENEQMLVTTYVLGPQSSGLQNQKMAETGTVTVSSGSENQGLANGTVTGSGGRSTGTQNQALAASDVGSASQSAGSEGQSLSAASTVLGRGFVTAVGTPGGSTIAWTNPANTEADDGSNAQWVKSEGVGAGTGTTDNGNMRMVNPKLGSTPPGFTRTKVEVLVHYNATTVGLAATGDSADHNVDLLDKTGATLQHLIADHFASNRTTADSTVAVDVTTACAGVSDADLALVQVNCYAQFARTLAATGTRSFTINVDSLSLRVTYTRSGIT